MRRRCWPGRRSEPPPDAARTRDRAGHPVPRPVRRPAWCWWSTNSRSCSPPVGTVTPAGGAGGVRRGAARGGHDPGRAGRDPAGAAASPAARPRLRRTRRPGQPGHLSAGSAPGSVRHEPARLDPRVPLPHPNLEPPDGIGPARFGTERGTRIAPSWVDLVPAALSQAPPVRGRGVLSGPGRDILP